MAELFRLLATTTVAHMIEREDFAKRLAEGTPVSMLELLYPLLQGYDSVAVKADVELGGTDQKFNLLMGRDIQRAYGQPEQVVLTTPLLTGTDGERKMSKSLGNYIGVTEPPEEMYGKTLSIPDTSMETWYGLLLGRAVPDDLSPRDAKRALARALVERFHGAEAAESAEEAFDRVHVQHEIPEDVPEVSSLRHRTSCTSPRCSRRPSASPPRRLAARWLRAGSSSTARPCPETPSTYRPTRLPGVSCSSESADLHGF